MSAQEREAGLLRFLKEQGIEYVLDRHKPVMTCEEALETRKQRNCVHSWPPI